MERATHGNNHADKTDTGKTELVIRTLPSTLCINRILTQSVFLGDWVFQGLWYSGLVSRASANVVTQAGRGRDKSIVGSSKWNCPGFYMERPTWLAVWLWREPM